MMEAQPLNERGSQESDTRPSLPPRPLPSDETLLSPSNLSPLSRNAGSEPLLRRKPVIPRRSSCQSLEAQSYELGQMKQMGSDQRSSDLAEEENLSSEYPPPKAFRKTHKFLGYDFGYWRMPARHMSIFSVLFLATFFPIYYASQGFFTIQEVNGPFSFDCTGSENGWSFIGINIRFGSYQYGRAKTIDLAWNWVVGRGLQALLTFVAYRVFQDALLRVTEMHPVPFELYATLALYSTKIDILWQLAKGLFRYGNWRTKAIFIWLIISTIYLATFPSLMDLCSGYDSAYQADFQYPDGGGLNNTADFENWDSPDVGVIINSTILCCTWNINSTTGAQYNITWSLLDRTSSQYEYDNDCYSPDGWYNSTTIYYWKDLSLNTSYWNEFEKYPGEMDVSKWSNWNFAPVDRNNFKCVALNNTYQWGFSFEWLFVAAIVNTVWMYGTWIVWLDCDVNSEFCKKGRRLGLWRAIADISEVMREELGPNICAYSEQELAEAVKKRGPIKYTTSGHGAEDLGHIGLSSKASGKLRLQWNRRYGTKLDEYVV